MPRVTHYSCSCVHIRCQSPFPYCPVVISMVQRLEFDNYQTSIIAGLRQLLGFDSYKRLLATVTRLRLLLDFDSY